MISEKLYGRILFPFYENVVRRRGTFDYYRDAASAPFMTREEIASLQEEKLGNLLSYAAEKVPYYGRLFAERGLDPGNTRTIDEVRDRGIVLTKDIVRREGDDLLSRDYRKEDLAFYETSGSTGAPLIVRMTHSLHAQKDAGKIRVEEWVGKEPGARSTIIWGRHAEVKFLKALKNSLYWKIRNYQFLNAFDIGEENLLRYVELIRKHRSRFLEAYVSVLYEMAVVMEKRGVAPPPLEGIIPGAEALYDFQKEQIEKSFQCPVYNRYGCSEFKSIAAECLNHKGMHINEDGLIVEVVDDEDRPVTGVPGNIVITDLDNLAMPMIRYRIGDIGIMSDRTCSCGRNFRMLEQVTGRDSDILRLPDGTSMASMIILWRFVGSEGVKGFQAVQKTPDELHLLVVENGEASRDAIIEYLTHSFVDVREAGMTLSFEFVDSIPLTKAGKKKYLVPYSGVSGKDRGE